MQQVARSARPARHLRAGQTRTRSRHALRPACAAASIAGVSVSGRMAELKAQGKIAFIPFIVAGDPDLETTAKALQTLDTLGADVIELGVPYSDPLADGAVIHCAATRALEKGATLDAVINMVKQVSPSLSAPLVLFTYYNPIMRRGLRTFCVEIKSAGAAGLLVPDVPLEETDAIRSECTNAGLELVLLATPTTPKSRMMDIARASQGFVYLVSVTGVTGVRENVESRVGHLVEMLHDVTDKSVAVGFGVSKPEHAQQIVQMGAEGVICGSALVRALGEAASPEEGLATMAALATSLRKAIP